MTRFTLPAESPPCPSTSTPATTAADTPTGRGPVRRTEALGSARRRGPRWGLGAVTFAAAASAYALAHGASEPPNTPASGLRTFSCAVAYMPARATWVRTVRLRYDTARLTEVLIDGQAPYTYSVIGTRVISSMDNERIVLDVATGQWTSDFRDKASGNGRCE